jgi:signal transduction histidine kinase
VNTRDFGSEVQLLAGVLLDDVERIAQRGAARIQELLPAYASIPRRELAAVVLAETRKLLEAIHDREGDRGRARDVSWPTDQTLAGHDISSDERLHGWLIALEVLREEASAVAEERVVSTSSLLEFMDVSRRWGDIETRASAAAHQEAEIRQLERLALEQAALRRVATMVACERPPEEVIAKVCEEVVLLLAGAEAALIQRYEPDGTATVVGSWAAPDNPVLVEHVRTGPFRLGRRSTFEGESITTLVYRTERSARIDDYGHATGSIGADARVLGLRSAVGSPIVAEGRLWGAIVAATTQPEPLPEDAESRIAQFTELVATAIANVQARAEVQRLAEEQAALRRVATLVAREAPPEEVFVTVAEEVGKLLGADSAAIQRYEPEGDCTVVGNWGKLGDAFRIGTRLTLEGSSVIALVHRTGRPVRVDSYEDAGGSAVRAWQVGLRSGAGSPIVVNGRPWGVMGVATSSEEPLPEGVEWRIAEFTELLGTAIGNVETRSDLAASRARIVATADEERRRVVRDLHDGAQQRLVHTIVTLKLARRAAERDPEGVVPLLDEALKNAQTAMDELRELAHGILPSVLLQGGLSAGVTALASRMRIPVEIDVSVDRLPSAVEASAYFVVAEALTNIAKHSKAHSATVRVALNGRTLRVEVRDNGVGGARPDGSGLVGLTDRLAAVGGSLRVESPASGGTVVMASVPIRYSGAHPSTA